MQQLCQISPKTCLVQNCLHSKGPLSMLEERVCSKNNMFWMARDLDGFQVSGSCWLRGGLDQGLQPGCCIQQHLRDLNSSNLAKSLFYSAYFSACYNIPLCCTEGGIPLVSVAQSFPWLPHLTNSKAANNSFISIFPTTSKRIPQYFSIEGTWTSAITIPVLKINPPCGCLQS